MLNIDPKTIRLRRATTDDITATTSLLGQCYLDKTDWQTWLGAFFNLPKSYLFVFDNPTDSTDDSIVACIGVSFGAMNGSMVAHISPLAVLPIAQHQGVATTLLGAVETFIHRHAATQKIETILLSAPKGLARWGYQPTHQQDELGYPLLCKSL